MTNSLMKVMETVRGIALLLTLIVTVGMLAGCSQADGAEASDESQTEEPVEATRLLRVETMVVKPEAFREAVQVTGVVDAMNDVTISAEAGGRVVEIVSLGSTVSKGEVIARFDERVLKSQLEAAEAAHDLAEATFRRQAVLFEDSVISALEYDNVRTRRDQAVSALEQARKMFADTRLTSPIVGRVEERFVEAGELVAPGSRVARVVDTRRVKIRAGVPERYAADIEERAPVRVRLSSQDLDQETRLSFVSRVVDAKSRTFDVELELENVAARLKPEMVVDVAIERRALENVLVVPQTAFVRDDLGTGLYVVTQEDGEHIAVRRLVVTGPTFDGMVVVESGIDPGDEVVVVGQSSLTDGNAVEIVAPTE